MGQRQTHRGKHPEDARLFGPESIPVLRRAVSDLSYLLTRGYAPESASTTVGDHYQLAARQRVAVERCACSDTSRVLRRRSVVLAGAVAGQAVRIDGYNLLICVESALSGGILLRGRDGCVRDMASVHGSYRRVEETLPALHAIGRTLECLGVVSAHWFFDSPVSNSARLKTLVEKEAADAGWTWEASLEHNPDKTLVAGTDIVITGDSWVLDRASRWFNLMDALLPGLDAPGEIVDLNET